MEEISSLDSFGADSSERPGGDTPKSDKSTEKPATSKEDSEAVADKTVNEQEKDVVEDTSKEASTIAEAVDGVEGEAEEDLEQISEGSLEMDEEHSQETKTIEEAQENKSAQEDVGNQENKANTSAEDVDAEEESANTNEVDDSKPGQQDKSVEADNLQVNEGEIECDADASDAVDGAPASNEAMEVDDAETSKYTLDESCGDMGDVEMRSVSVDSRQAAEQDGKAEIADNDAQSEGRDTVDGDQDNASDIDEVYNDDNTKDTGTGTQEVYEADDVNADIEQNDDIAEIDGEGEETVENVLEPEESDVCLIPDDPESEVTEAEKELARENAEKAEKAREQEDAEQVQAANKSPLLEAVAAGDVKSTEADVGAEEVPSDEVEPTDVGAEADAGGLTDELEETTHNEDDSGDMGDCDAVDGDEPMQEEISNADASEEGATPKIIISWIVASLHKCNQCNEDKTCGFRYKKSDVEATEEDATEQPTASKYEYLCDQACCDALLEAQPGKYFVRRKKFLIEEVNSQDAQPTDESTEADSTAEADSMEAENAQDADPTANVVANELVPINDCLQCKEPKKCKYFLKQDQDTYYICDDDCFNLLNADEPEKYKLKRHSIRVRNIGATTIRSTSKKPETNVMARTNAEAEAARLDRLESLRRRCADCQADIILGEKQLMWETMDFCNEVCLGSYQRAFGSNCETCKQEVSAIALGKYCVRFGFDVRQFCCAACLNMFKKGLKTCSCCQKDISSGQEGFLAPVGDKDQFKDFCSQVCLRRYDNMCNPKKKLRTDMCGVCNNEKLVRVEMLLDDKEHYFCSNPCFSAFKFVSNVNADQCAMCCKYFERKSAEAYTIYSDLQSTQSKMFCSRICINVYIIVNRHIVSCQWCKVKKYNFDMISKLQGDQETQTCSINCLTMHGVSCNISTRTVTKCDNCSNASTPQYHLTMSDASMRNFCTYQCVMQFQNQFARAPLTLESDMPSTSSTQQQSSLGAGGAKSGAPFPTGLPKRVKLKLSQQSSNAGSSLNKKASPTTVVPVISTVQSLASGETEARIGNVTMRRNRIRGRKLDSPPLMLNVAPPTAPPVARGRPRKHVDYGVQRSPSPAPLTGRRNTASGDFNVTETKIITVPPYPTQVRNVNISCKPMTVTQGEQCTPSMRDCATQTEKDYSNKVLIPVPVPIFLPQPMYMYSAPFPVPVPIPLPIPVPIFIPTTRNTAQGILKEIKKIQDKMPEDPLEAELLMMAEMVAEEKHDSDSDSDNEIKPDPGLVTLQYQNNMQQQQQVDDVNATGHNPYGDDMLQIALKMATGDYDQHQQTPTVDLESTMTANTISNQSPGMVPHDAMAQMGVHQLEQQHHMLDSSQRSPRGRKRGSALIDTTTRNNRSPVKRQRGNELDPNALQQQQAVQQQQEKPDAQMFLKYTFGVNAWKQWVMTKNADIEKSTIRKRLFKTELLQMTADELNFSLCLFVKEVRKPNGTEYAPDTIYYLVLGIQQYLYVNGRIDNIFYDPYYERFTECLDEVARKFSVLYNDSQYIVTRVEEEHLWECKQLGAHSPHVLLSTLMFFNTKHFNLTTVEEHMQLSFSHIMKHWKRSTQNAKMPGTRNVLLRFYPPQAGLDANPRKKKVYEQQENEDNPLRCPVRLYEFYLSKCPESVKTRNDVFYLQPERSCVPDSPVWYSTQALSQEALQRMLHRVKMVKEINIALLTT